MRYKTHAILLPCISTAVTFLVLIFLIRIAGMHALFTCATVLCKNISNYLQTLLSLQTSVKYTLYTLF